MKKLVKFSSIGIAVALIAVLVIAFMPASVTINQSGLLSVGSNVVLAVNNPPEVGWFEEVIVTEEPWGFRYRLWNGDVVEVGDSTTTYFKAHVKTIRWNGVADFSLWLDGSSFEATLTDDTVSFDFDSQISINIYPSPPSSRIPEGGIEYDITLNSRLAQNEIGIKTDWNNITWIKVLPLDEEYDQSACTEEWGAELAPFTITPTSITSDVTSGVLLTREEYKVNSYIGMATKNTHTNSGDLGNGVTYSTVSRSYLHIHRGKMTDNLGDTAWVEDINLDESKKEFTFTLPKTWLKNATYPVSQVCGVDPAYTEDMDSFADLSDNDNWVDYDIFTEHGTPKNSIVEIIVSNDDAGKEFWGGIRTDGSSLSRRLLIHEAEGGGKTTCRMFALVDETSGYIECYSDDLSDIIFTIVGYWGNVGFTESIEWITVVEATWTIDALSDSGAANKVGHFVLFTTEEAGNNLGVREVGSLERKILVHESEGGGYSSVDMFAKFNSSYQIQAYEEGTSGVRCWGYFGPEMDFVELFQSIDHTDIGVFQVQDLTAYLDEDGRMVDFLLTHNTVGGARTIGLRGGDSSVGRYLVEHEAEDNGTSTGEVTGFGISAQSNASGEVQTMSSTNTTEVFYLMGYFKPVVDGPSISNTPDSKGFGTLEVNTYSSTAINFFTIENTGSGAVDIVVYATDLTGGDDTWDLSDTATPGENIYGMYAGLDDDDDLFDVIVRETEAYNELVNNLAELATQDWGLRLYMPATVTNYDGQQMSATLTLVCSAH